MDRWLNRLAQLAMVVIAVTALVVVLRSPSKPSPQVVSAYQPGDRIDLRKLPVSGPALLIATRSTCGFCTESISFWRTITGASIVWLAVGEDASTNREYLLAHGLKADHVLALGDAGIAKVSATPTVIFVDGDGRVIKAWVGLLDSNEQDDLRATIAKLGNL